MKFLKIFHSIKTKLLLIAFLILTIPLIVLGVFSYKKSQGFLDDSGNKRLETTVEMTLEMISTLHDEVEKGNLLLEEAQEKVKEAVLGEEDPSRSEEHTSELQSRGHRVCRLLLE